MKNSNDSLKEKAIRANELKNVSGGNDHGPPYTIIAGGVCTKVECHNCHYVCPTGALEIGYTERRWTGWTLELNRSKCIGCGRCADVCPTHQIAKY